MQSPMRDKLGVCQWFHYEAYADVERAVDAMRELGIRHLRTGISWADYHRVKGKQWYDWQMRQLEEFEVLLSIWHTPPSIAEGSVCAGPPVRLLDYAHFIGEVIERYGQQFADLELWNEPNNIMKWNFERFDPWWSKFGYMIREAGNVAQQLGKRTVLGGMIPVDHHWLQLIESYGTLAAIDVVAIHAFPQMWWDHAPCWDRPEHWHGWRQKIQYIAEHTQGRPIWVTETGLATWDPSTRAHGRYQLQSDNLQAAARAPVDRVYWYCLVDLASQRAAIEGFHVDENEYHLGLITESGNRKPAWHTMRALLRSDGLDKATRHARVAGLPGR